MKLTYCTKCVMPNTKPDLFFDEQGVCDACRSSEKKNAINWDERKKEFEQLIEKFRDSSGGNYDCVIPVSGGKDSTYQTYIMKKVYGFNPLCVSFEPTDSTELGKKNLANLGNFGVDLIQFRKNPIVYKKMVIEGFKRVGDPEWPNHLGIFTVPVRIALQYKIPLVIWGENSQLEYGGPSQASERRQLDRRWLEEFGGLLGNRVDDMVGVDGITLEDLVAYKYPKQQDLDQAGITGVFLGSFFKWNAREHLEISKQQGFSVKEDGPVECTYTNYENLDEATYGVHDYLKFLKYGFCRATDHACLDIRNGRISREEGMLLVRRYDDKYPHKSVNEFIKYSGLSKKEIDEVFDRFTNKQIFKTDEQGNLIRDIAGNLSKINYDNQ